MCAEWPPLGRADAERPINVFLPETLVRIGDVAVRLRVVIGAGRAGWAAAHVVRGCCYKSGHCRMQLRRERIGAEVLDPVEDGFVINDVITGRVVVTDAGAAVVVGTVLEQLGIIGKRLARGVVVEEILSPIVDAGA